MLDEADRMLDMGFIHDIKKVLAVLPAKKQTLLFSATFSDEIKALADQLLNEPALIEVARRNPTADDDRAEGASGRPRTQEGPAGAPDQAAATGTRCWCSRARSTAPTGSPSTSTTDGISAMAIHGNKSQTARTKALAEFKSGELQVLVATDIAARGIDIDQLPHVVNFELPNVPEDYVHRIGRTGRAGAQGEAISLVCVDEDIFLRDIERLIKRSDPARGGRPASSRPRSEKAEPIVLGRMTIGVGGTRRNGGGGGGGRRQVIAQAQAAAAAIGVAARLRVALRRRRPDAAHRAMARRLWQFRLATAAGAAAAGRFSDGQGDRGSACRPVAPG